MWICGKSSSKDNQQCKFDDLYPLMWCLDVIETFRCKIWKVQWCCGKILDKKVSNNKIHVKASIQSRKMNKTCQLHCLGRSRTKLKVEHFKLVEYLFFSQKIVNFIRQQSWIQDWLFRVKFLLHAIDIKFLMIHLNTKYAHRWKKKQVQKSYALQECFWKATFMLSTSFHSPNCNKETN